MGVPPVASARTHASPWLLLALLACALPSQRARALDGYVTLASSHQWRGVSLSDGPTMMLGAEQALAHDWAIGAWGAGVDRAWPFGVAKGKLLAGAYLARDWRCGEHCSGRMTLSRYLHPGSAPGGWSELAVSARWRERIGFNLAHGRSDDSGRSSRNIELFAEQPLGASWTGALLLGHTDYAGFGYRHAELELRRPLGRWQLSLGAWHGETAPPVGPDRQRGRVFVALSRGFGGRR